MHESEKWKWNHSVVSDPPRPMDRRPPGSPIHGIFQARVLEWGAIAQVNLVSHLSFLRGWDGWMASRTWWTWVWASSGNWWWIGKPGLLQSTGSQRVGHDWVTELNWTVFFYPCSCFPFSMQLSKWSCNESDHLSPLLVLQWLLSSLRVVIKVLQGSIRFYNKRSFVTLWSYLLLLTMSQLCSTISRLLCYINMLSMFPPQNLILCVKHFLQTATLFITCTTLDLEHSVVLIALNFSLPHVSVSPSKILYNQLISMK